MRLGRVWRASKAFWSTTEPNVRQTIDAAPDVSYMTARFTFLKRGLLVQPGRLVEGHAEQVNYALQSLVITMVER